MEFEIRRNSEREPWTYALLDLRQRELLARIQRGERGAFLLSELAPVITLGRRARPETLLFSKEQFQQLGVELYHSDRGGFETYHGPGQWVLFAVEKLETLTGDSRGVRRAVEGLLQIGLRTARKYVVSAHLREGHETGIWSDKGKIGSVGVHVLDGVLLHGLSVNGFKTPLSFQGLNPCGLKASVDFLLQESGSNAQEQRFLELGQDIQNFTREVFR